MNLELIFNKIKVYILNFEEDYNHLDKEFVRLHFNTEKFLSYKSLKILHDHNNNSYRLNLIILSHIRYMEDILIYNSCESITDFCSLLTLFYDNIYGCRETINKMTKKNKKIIDEEFLKNLYLLQNMIIFDMMRFYKNINNNS